MRKGLNITHNFSDRHLRDNVPPSTALIACNRSYVYWMEARCTQIWGFRLPQVICLRRQALCQISAPKKPSAMCTTLGRQNTACRVLGSRSAEDRDNKIEQRPVRYSDKGSGWPPYAHIPISSKVPSGLATRLFESISLGVVAP